MIRRSSKTIAALKHSVLFRSVPRATLDRLAAIATMTELDREKEVFRSNTRAAGVHLVIKGWLMSYVATSDANKVIELIGAGEHTGLAATVMGIAHTTTVETVTDCTLVFLPRAPLLACALETPQLALQIAAALSLQVQLLIADIEAFSLRPGRQRVAEYLRQLGSLTGTSAEPFLLPAPKGVIASRLNLTPEYFSRVLHELVDAGEIKVDGRHITLLTAQPGISQKPYASAKC